MDIRQHPQTRPALRPGVLNGRDRGCCWRLETSLARLRIVLGGAPPPPSTPAAKICQVLPRFAKNFKGFLGFLASAQQPLFPEGFHLKGFWSKIDFLPFSPEKM